jgi:hypothetical protein
MIGDLLGSTESDEMSILGHQLPATSKSDDRFLCEVYRPIGRVSAETSSLNIGSCGELSLTPQPGKSLLSAEAV